MAFKFLVRDRLSSVNTNCDAETSLACGIASVSWEKKELRPTYKVEPHPAGAQFGSMGGTNSGSTQSEMIGYCPFSGHSSEVCKS